MRAKHSFFVPFFNFPPIERESKWRNSWLASHPHNESSQTREQEIINFLSLKKTRLTYICWLWKMSGLFHVWIATCPHSASLANWNIEQAILEPALKMQLRPSTQGDNFGNWKHLKNMINFKCTIKAMIYVSVTFATVNKIKFWDCYYICCNFSSM